MLISLGLFYIISSFSILSSFFVIISKNPIFSVLFLILSFTNVSCLFFLFNFEFLPISFLIVYVGAIAVLFLFVLMMLNIKLAELQESYNNFWAISIFFGILFLVELLFLFRTEFVFIDLFQEGGIKNLAEYTFSITNESDVNNTLGLSTNVKNISQALFKNYLFHFILAGFVLLLAMVAAIVLTLQKTFVSKNQNIYKQIMSDYNNTIVNYS
jgi:NADH-quinone oxidoreductase subunit J